MSPEEPRRIDAEPGLDPHLAQIVALAWSRRLGLPDGSLAPGTTSRASAVDDDAIRILALAGAEAVLAPEWFLAQACNVMDASRHLPIEQLLRRDTVRGLLGTRIARTRGPWHLWFAGDYGTRPTEPPLVSDATTDVVALESKCPPDDVAEAALSHRQRWFTVVDEPDHEPVAGAGFDEHEGLVADLGVLTAPEHRRRGLGSTVLGLAVDDILDQGLVPQLQIAVGNLGVEAFARRAGFVPLGTYLEIALSDAEIHPHEHHHHEH